VSGRSGAPQGLIARVGDSCLWFGRYLERAESTARELQATLSLALDGELTPRQCWVPLVVVAGEQASFRQRFGEEALEDGELVQDWLVWAEGCGVSLSRSIAAARENARSIRDVLSGEAWQAVNELYLWSGSEGARREWSGQRDGFYRRVQKDAQLCFGLLRSTMLHDTVLDFMWLGMLLERVGQTARLLDVHHHAFGAAQRPHQVLETTVWMALLRALSGAEPFMRAHAGRVTGEAVAGFLLSESRFPRSIAYCVRSAHERLCAIRPPADAELPGGAALARLAALDDWVSRLPRDLAASGALHEKLTHLVDETASICDTISREMFGAGVEAPGPALVES
jgi:uncharacterized alpha-E superfamily protein